MMTQSFYEDSFLIFQGVLSAESALAFEQQIQAALQLSQEASLIQTIQKQAQENSWKKRAFDILEACLAE